MSTTPRNPKAFNDAMFMRCAVAAILARHTHLERLTYKNIRELLGGDVSLDSVKRHVRWCRRAFQSHTLPAFLQHLVPQPRARRRR